MCLKARLPRALKISGITVTWAGIINPGQKNYEPNLFPGKIDTGKRIGGKGEEIKICTPVPITVTITLFSEKIKRQDVKIPSRSCSSKTLSVKNEGEA